MGTARDDDALDAPAPARLELNTASDPANLAPARKAVEDFARAAGFDAASAGEVGLCVNEAMANVIRHAYAGAPDRPIRITASAGESAAETASGTPGAVSGSAGQPPLLELVVELRDWGNGIDPSTLPPEPYNPLEPGGVGLICLQKLMDRVVYTPQPDGMLLSMTRTSRRPPVIGVEACDCGPPSRGDTGGNDTGGDSRGKEAERRDE